MRLCFALLASLSLVACGGGDDADRADAGPRPDARPDAEAAPDCLFGSEYVVSLGSEENGPATFDGSFGQDDSGNWVVAVYGGLESLPDEPAAYGYHGLTIYLQDNTGMFADVAPFGPGIVGAETTLDGITTDCGGCMYGYSGMATSQVPSSSNLPTQAYLADSGTLTFTNFDDIVDDGTTEVSIVGTFTDVVLTGYDYETEQVLEPACTSNVDLSINFLATFSSTAVAPFGKNPRPLVANQPIRFVRK